MDCLPGSEGRRRKLIDRPSAFAGHVPDAGLRPSARWGWRNSCWPS